MPLSRIMSAFSATTSSTAVSTTPVSAGVNPFSSAIVENHSSLCSNPESMVGPSSQSIRVIGTTPSLVTAPVSRAWIASIKLGHGTSASSLPLPSATSERRLSRMVEPHAFAGTGGHPQGPPSTPIMRISSISEPRIASTWLSEIPVPWRRFLLCSEVRGSSSLMLSQCSSVISRTGMSVSGYILAPPGSGLIAVVVPSSGWPLFMTTLRTSWGMRWYASRARRTADSKANSACHSEATHRANASSSVNDRASLTASTSEDEMS